MARESNETHAKFCDGADRQFAPAMRCANENNSFDPRISVKNEPAMGKTPWRQRFENLLCWFAHSSLPILAPESHHLHVGKNSAQTVGNQDVALVVWVKLVYFRQGFAQLESRVSDRVTGRIPKFPILIASSQHRIRLEVIDNVEPHLVRALEALNEYQRNPLGIVRLKKTETGRACEMTYGECAHQSGQSFVDMFVIKEWRRIVG